MPGRCAAPPAAAMMTLSPRASAVAAYSNIQSGVRCAETMRLSYGIPSSSSKASAGASVSASDELPMITPTRAAERSCADVRRGTHDCQGAGVLGSRHEDPRCEIRGRFMDPAKCPSDRPGIVIAGRSNVGKSSLVNRVLIGRSPAPARRPGAHAS
jgi:hypothetical protein